MKLLRFRLVFILIAVGLSLSFKSGDLENGLRKVTINDDYNYIAINQIFMYVSNNGNSAYDPFNAGSGLFWPGGITNTNKAAIFEDGLVWGGKIGREIRVGGSTYRQGLQAGKILPDGTADDPSRPRYKIFKIRKDFRTLPPGAVKDKYEEDYNNWPVEDGAPWVDVDGDGVFTRGVDEPEFIGDEVLWFVSNDLDEARTLNLYGSSPLGLEMQATIFAFNDIGDLGDIVFKKFLIINKGTNTIKDMYLAQWSDPDLGDAGDDFVGVDTSLSLGYVFNGKEVDNVYLPGVPPAAGYDFFQGPIVPSLGDTAKFLSKPRPGYKNLPLTGFTAYINGDPTLRDPELGSYTGTIEMYNYLIGLNGDGDPFVSPTGDTVDIILTGDPVTRTGWYEGEEEGAWKIKPGDRRLVMASGPFVMAPGDSQEIVVAVIVARGADRLDSITELKRKDIAAQIAFDLNFNLTPPPPPPTLKTVTGDQRIELYWETNAESYDVVDVLLKGSGLDDTTYTFEGYRVFQFSDQAGSDKKLIGIFDIPNDITTIYGIESINGENVTVPIIKSNNNGLKRSLSITLDELNGRPLRNGTPYYFAVTAYGYSPNSITSYKESSPVIVEAIPAKQRIDVTYEYDSSELILSASDDNPDATIGFLVVDPNVMTNSTFTVDIVDDGADGLAYNLFKEIDASTRDTIYYEKTRFTSRAGADSAEIFDGVSFFIEDTGLDSLNDVTSRFKNFLEIANGTGVLETPVDVNGRLNSTGTWKLTSEGTKGDNRDNINWSSAEPGIETYEIRFTDSGSEYYATGYANGFVTTAPVKDDFKAKNKVPFEVWTLGTDLNSTDDDQRLIIKILDLNKSDSTAAIPDSVWTQFPASDPKRANQWEQIFVYYPVDSIYSEPLPDRSGFSNKPKGLHKFGQLIIEGDLPATGTIIRLDTWKPLTPGNSFTIKTTEANKNDLVAAKTNIDKINVFPNPYFGASALDRSKYQSNMRFINLPAKATIRIFSISGVFITRLEKDDDTRFKDWGLRNIDGLPVASGMYIAHIDMPGIGTKILKLAVIQEKAVLDGI
jgi:hypothetical protein